MPSSGYRTSTHGHSSLVCAWNFSHVNLIIGGVYVEANLAAVKSHSGRLNYAILHGKQGGCSHLTHLTKIKTRFVANSNKILGVVSCKLDKDNRHFNNGKAPFYIYETHTRSILFPAIQHSVLQCRWDWPSITQVKLFLTDRAVLEKNDLVYFAG